MNIEQISVHIPEYAKDIRLNLKTLLHHDGIEGLTPTQQRALLLVSSYATKHQLLISTFEKSFVDDIDAAHLKAAKAAHSIMAMNNIYYRFVHALDDKKWLAKPAQLRMNVISNPGIKSSTFELMCLAVSMINGCGLCMKSHTSALQKQGVTEDAIQSTARIASVVNATAAALPQ